MTLVSSSRAEPEDKSHEVSCVPIMKFGIFIYVFSLIFL